MQLIDTDLTLAEREQVEAAMGSDKQVLWFSRPVAKLWTAESVMSMIGGLVAAPILATVCFSFFGGDCKPDGMFLLLLACFFLPIIGAILWQILTPWRLLRKKRRTAYILTAQQAIVLQPGWFGKLALTSYPVCPGMVKEREAAADGSGSLVFGYRTVHGKNGSCQMGQGFLSVPCLQQVSEILDSLTAGEQPVSMPAETERHTTPSAGKKSTAGVVIGCLFALIGLGVLIFACSLGYESWQKAENGVTVQGKVVSLKRECSSGRRSSGTTYYPVFRFTAQDGKEYRVEHNQGSNPPAWKKGEEVELIYLPDDPQSAVPNTFWGKYGVTVFLLIFGSGFAGIGGCVAWSSRK